MKNEISNYVKDILYLDNMILNGSALLSYPVLKYMMSFSIFIWRNWDTFGPSVLVLIYSCTFSSHWGGGGHECRTENHRTKSHNL